MKYCLLVVTALLASMLAGSSAVIIHAGTSALAAQPRLTATRAWTRAISPNADSAPAYALLPRSISCPGGKPCKKRLAVVYALAGNNGSNCNPGDPVRAATLYAFKAQSGAPLWTRSTAGPSRCTTAGPVVDPSGRWVYAPGLDGKMHRYNARTGTEYRKQGWPVTVTLMPDTEKMAATATAHGHYLYVTTSGFIGDQGHYEGHLVTINLKTGRSQVFNSLCSNIRALLVSNPSSAHYCSRVQSGLFGRGQGAIDPITHDVYVVSGNGPWNGSTDWGDSIMKLTPSGSRLVDSYTPQNQHTLNVTDADLGSTGPALLPPITSGGRTYHLLVQGGKGPACEGCNGVALRLLNRDNLSGAGGPGHLGGDLADTGTPGGCEVLTAPAVWQANGAVDVIYANDCGTAAYRVTSPSGGHFALQRAWSNGRSGTTPVISGGVLYVAHGGAVTAYDPSSGNVLASIGGIGGIHWEYPLVAGGRLYITDQSGRLTAFRLHS